MHSMRLALAAWRVVAARRFMVPVAIRIVPAEAMINRMRLIAKASANSNAIGIDCVLRSDRKSSYHSGSRAGRSE